MLCPAFLPTGSKEINLMEEIMFNRKSYEFDGCPVSYDYIKKSQDKVKDLKRFN